MLLPLFVTISITIVFILVNANFADAQTKNEIEWKNHTSSHHKLSIQYPSTWDLDEGQESRFDEYQELFISHMDGQNYVDASLGVHNYEMPDGPLAELQNQKDNYVNPEDEQIAVFRIIEDIQPFPTKIDGEDAYSFLMAADYIGSDDTSAFLTIATMHNDQGYIFGFLADPATLFDDPEIAEIRDKMINSIKWID